MNQKEKIMTKQARLKKILIADLMTKTYLTNSRMQYFIRREKGEIQIMGLIFNLFFRRCLARQETVVITVKGEKVETIQKIFTISHIYRRISN